MQPTLTTTIANYNHGHFIGRAIENVMTQSRKPEEVLIHDDGSTDNSIATINAYVQKYPTLRVQGTYPNQGIHSVLPELVAASRSEWLHMLAADDFPLSGFYEKAMRLVKIYPQVGLVMGNMLSVDEETGDQSIISASDFLPPGYISPQEFLYQYLAKAPPNHSLCGAMLWRKQCIIDNGMFYDDLISWSDTFTAWNIALSNGIIYINDIVACIRISKSAYSGSIGQSKQKLFMIVKNARARMRSKEYAHHYPKIFVDDWSRRFLEMIAKMP